MIQSDETFNGSFPYSAKFTESPGFRMHYIDEGPRDGQVVLCLHGEPTWGYLFRHLVGALHENCRVLVPDHMGFGKSATPQDRTYWLQDHVDNLERFVLALDLRDITLVMHDFGGPVGMGLAARHPDRIRRIIAANGPTPFGQASLVERLTTNAQVSPWFQWIMKAQSQDRLKTVLGELGFNILSTLKLNGFENHALISDTWLRAYGAHFMDPSDSAGVIGWAEGFAINAHRFETPDAGARRQIQSRPALAIWGLADRTLHAEHFLPLFSELFPQAPIHRLAGVGHYCLEDGPDTIAAHVTAFMRQT
ncbi:alpha/beta fold hydrolase [Dyella sp. GSA-30]|uniref:alpha/beta fold hydrolase n=1 Tax=Dyella sp. GSA-30 TaxID=2994496 RepID=UPI002492DBB1|nr:alpha/beta fold hydrolase [Dyella sp. GSA-30]BDU22444.1 haloalkane dehalogenase [Dyella sp. GSA-30]